MDLDYFEDDKALWGLGLIFAFFLLAIYCMLTGNMVLLILLLFESICLAMLLCCSYSSNAFVLGNMSKAKFSWDLYSKEFKRLNECLSSDKQLRDLLSKKMYVNPDLLVMYMKKIDDSFNAVATKDNVKKDCFFEREF